MTPHSQLPALILAAILTSLGISAGAPAVSLVAPAAQDTPFHIATTPYPQLAGPRNTFGGWWRERFMEKSQVAAAGGFEVMLVGDSITHGIDNGKDNGVFAQQLAPARYGNFGFSGDRTENVLWRLEHGHLSGNIAPKVILLMLGTNNTGHRMDAPEEIALGVEAVVRRLTTRFPQAHLLLLAIFPRGATVQDPMRVNNAATNAMLAKLDGKAAGHVHFMDIGSKFLLEDGSLPKDIMPDLLHPNAKGYAIWAEAVVPEIKKLLKN